MDSRRGTTMLIGNMPNIVSNAKTAAHLKSEDSVRAWCQMLTKYCHSNNTAELVNACFQEYKEGKRAYIISIIQLVNIVMEKFKIVVLI